MNIIPDKTKCEEYSKKKIQTRISFLVSQLIDWNTFLADENHVYCWNDQQGIYQETVKDYFCKVFRILYQTYWEDYSTKKGEEAFEQIRIAHFIERKNWPLYSNLIPFNNGIYNRDTKTLIMFHQKYKITAKLTFDYSEQRPLLFEGTLHKLLPNALDRYAVLQYLAYCLTDETKFQVAQLWWGNGNNGKSSLAELLIKILGPFATTFDLSRLNKDAGYITQVLGKRFALCSEMGGNFLYQETTEKIKRMITDQFLDGRAAYEKALVWTNTTKYLITSNKLPRIQDRNDKAFWRRWKLIQFTQDFTGHEDRELFNDIFENEAGMILSHLVRDIDYSTITADPWEEVQAFWLSYASNTRQFLKEQCTIDNTKRVSTEILYNAYSTWCREQPGAEKPDIVSRQTFSKELRRMGITHNQSNSNYFYENVRLNSGEGLDEIPAKRLSVNPIYDEFELEELSHSMS